ncbi:hypothetical protein CDD83_242 [Cordyceps sp. RAO-2017]|nr:hypothetical protein CDD83_242 [Cordyceps sp. RAO-2017]
MSSCTGAERCNASDGPASASPPVALASHLCHELCFSKARALACQDRGRPWAAIVDMTTLLDPCFGPPSPRPFPRVPNNTWLFITGFISFPPNHSLPDLRWERRGPVPAEGRTLADDPSSDDGPQNGNKAVPGRGPPERAAD